MSSQVSRGSPGVYQADEQPGVGGSAGYYQADEQAVSRGSVFDYQADEQAGVVRLSRRISGE